jgi:hypothetical protein
MTVSRSTAIAAPAQQVWELVSDLPGMGRLSPENVGGSWKGGATGAAVGARFKGRNRNGWRRWSTVAKVTRSSPGQAFAFEISYLGIPVSLWSYELAATPEGCTATETWSDRRPGWFKVVGGVATGVMDRSDDTTAVNLEHTLAAVKALAEAP